MTRVLDNQPLLAFPLLESQDDGAVSPRDLDAVPVAAGVSRDWFRIDPPPLPNRTVPPKDWAREFHDIKDHPEKFGQFREPDPFKAWSADYVGDPCMNEQLRASPNGLFVLQPPDTGRFPTYRYLQNATTPLGLVTNQIGWRGPPIEVPRGKRTIRVVFVGASTTAAMHNLPYSYPEYIEPWLNRWAASRHLDVHFETLNAGRESIDSRDIAAIVHREVLPLHPELVVYYEGANQFEFSSIAPDAPKGSAARPTSSQERAPPWLRFAGNYIELARRFEALAGYAETDLDGGEWPKPAYRLIWPQGLSESDPDLAFPQLPVRLNSIERDLDHMRQDLGGIGAEFAVSSFFRLAQEGMKLNPVRHRFILEDLNAGLYPFSYRDIERLTNFENRVFAKYAAVHGLPFVDVAGTMPRDPDLLIDSIHTNTGGTRMLAWVVLQQLIPLIEKHVADGSWPAPQPAEEPALPTFTTRHIDFNCAKP